MKAKKLKMEIKTAKFSFPIPALRFSTLKWISRLILKYGPSKMWEGWLTPSGEHQNMGEIINNLSPEDIEGMHASQGILTQRGGMTSHAAVVARGMGTCCVSGCGELQIDEVKKTMTLGGKKFKEKDYISLDGTTGTIYAGDIATKDADISGNFGRIMRWADQYRKMQVRTNADTPADTANAVRLGAEGIGLCRTEHMFFDAERIPKFRRMILSDSNGSALVQEADNDDSAYVVMPMRL